MGVKAPIGVTRAYYFAYWIGLFISGFSFWVLCKIWPPPIMETGWKEPKDYVRPEEQLVIEGQEETSSIGGGEGGKITSKEGTVAV